MFQLSNNSVHRHKLGPKRATDFAKTQLSFFGFGFYYSFILDLSELRISDNAGHRYRAPPRGREGRGTETCPLAFMEALAVAR